MEQPQFEFLVVCQDILEYRTITGAIQKINGAVNYTANNSTARAYIARRKIDGIFVDTAVQEALELIQDIRNGSSNRYSVIFACARAVDAPAVLLSAGANFVLQKPLLVEGIAHVLDTAIQMMEAERKRYTRHQLMVPVLIRQREREQRATTANISKGGMAVRCQDAYEAGVSVDFAVSLPIGEINGQGQVAWANTDGLMGIKFHLLPEPYKKSLASFLDQRTDLSAAKQP
jgi:response regulator RpfG family c-di-GMP phosphodiesterase